MPLVEAIDDTLIPPPERQPPYARRGDFKAAGAAFVETAAACGLRGDHRVLDIGCGVGRFAVAFAAYADGNASYEGLDTSPAAIETCQEVIAASDPRFRFQVVDVFNSYYRPDADAAAAAYRFPFPDGSFDFVFSNSLFTHLTRRDFRQYLREIGRVLKPGGRTLNTFFLINRESKPRSREDFPHKLDDGVARVRSLEQPEAAIAYREPFVRRAHAAAGLRIDQPIRYGKWSGREAPGAGFGNKDLIVATRA